MASFDIIMPVFNGEKYLERSVASVLNQTFHDFNLVIIDDGSSDMSAEICSQFGLYEDRVRYFSTCHSGVSHARNFGISHATADFVLFLDCDDYLPPYTLAEYSRITSLYDCDWVVALICETDKVLNSYSLSKNLQDIKPIVEKVDDFLISQDPSYLSFKLGATGSKLFKRKLLQEYGIKFNLTFLPEDTKFNIDYLKHIDTIMLFPALQYVYFRQNPNSLSAVDQCTKIQYKINTLHELLNLYRFRDLPRNSPIVLKYKCIIDNMIGELDPRNPDIFERKKAYCLQMDQFGKQIV